MRFLVHLASVLPTIIVCGAVFVAPALGASKSTEATTCSVMAVHPGQRFSITLASNPSTGYRWDVEYDLDPHIIQEGPIASYVPATAKVVGAAGSDTFNFQARELGVAVIAMKYYRPSDKLSVPAAREAFYVVVVR